MVLLARSLLLSLVSVIFAEYAYLQVYSTRLYHVNIIGFSYLYTTVLGQICERFGVVGTLLVNCNHLHGNLVCSIRIRFDRCGTRFHIIQRGGCSCWHLRIGAVRSFLLGRYPLLHSLIGLILVAIKSWLSYFRHCVSVVRCSGPNTPKLSWSYCDEQGTWINERSRQTLATSHGPTPHHTRHSFACSCPCTR